MVRSRSKQDPDVSVAWSYQNYFGTPQHGINPTTSANGTYVRESGSQYFEDIVTKNLRGKIADGKIVNNPMSSKRIVTRRPDPVPFNIYYRSNYSWNCSNGHASQKHYDHAKGVGTWKPADPDYLLLSESTLGAIVGVAKNAAVMQAHANIDESEMLALASAAESGKTVDSMLAIYGRLRRILRHLRRFQISKVAQELNPRELEQRYMEYRYAIRPLMYDALGVVKSLEKNRGYARRTYRGYGENTATFTAQQSTPSTIWYGVSHYYQLETTVVATAKAGVLCDVSINDITVFGIDQVPSTLWELTPFSFIVDWFVGCGDYIAAHTPNAGVRQRASWVTTKTVVTHKASSGPMFNSLPSTSTMLSYSAGAHEFVREETFLERTVDPQLSTFPIIDLNLDMWKLTDMGIILKNIIKGR